MDGSIPWVARVLFFPYFAMNWLALALLVVITKEDVFNHIEGKIYVGRRPLPWEVKRVEAEGFTAILDVTSEFSGWARDPRCAFLNIPVIDGTAPNQDTLMRGARWLEKHEGRGKVLVHCAVGHGRSALFAACFFSSKAPGRSANEIISILQQGRPGIRPKPEQLKALDVFAQNLREG